MKSRALLALVTLALAGCNDEVVNPIGQGGSTSSTSSISATSNTVASTTSVASTSSAESSTSVTSTTTATSTVASSSGTGGGIGVGDLAPDFSLLDVNPASPTANQMVSPRDYLGHVTGWYFGHAT